MARQSGWCIDRRQLLIGVPLAVGLAAAAKSIVAPVAKGITEYRVKLIGRSPLRLSVVAELPIDGEHLNLSEEYPAELPAMAKQGWPALISNLVVRDPSGTRLDAVEVKDGWRLAQRQSGRVRLSYDIDFSLFEAANWPSPTESAIADDATVALSCRPLFIQAGQAGPITVSLDAPRPWRAVAPWPTDRSDPRRYAPKSRIDLVDNMLVFSKRAPDIVTAAGFRLQITSMGHWKPLRPLVRRTLQDIITREVALMGDAGREVYNVILLPTADTGGNAYRQSFVYSFANPTVANRGAWANTLAHEIFHYWNYARLQGADYASSQWFQEGFTEYVANLTMLSSRIDGPDDFLARLGKHVANSRKLTTTLEAIGTHKGPPLYSAGALVAFSFDVMIRRATLGKRNIGNFFRSLWRLTDGGARHYAWPDIEAALRATADADWNGFYDRHIRGNTPLPLEQSFALAGLQHSDDSGSPRVSIDPAANPTARAVWLNLSAPGERPYPIGATVIPRR